jgi:hypothetical protein
MIYTSLEGHKNAITFAAVSDSEGIGVGSIPSAQLTFDTVLLVSQTPGSYEDSH